MNILGKVKPERVFAYFEEISKIPRCSYHEEGISNYLKDLGERLGLETIQDEYMNIIIRKPASKAYESSPGVIIQGHMDMVCEKEDTSEHDFKKDPIDLSVEGDYIKANKTSLGGDNGIGVAMGLAILEDKSLEHPSLELLITTAEEVGMDGAIALSDTILKGKRLINVDSDEEGILTIGSAGGALVDLRLPVEYEKMENAISFSIEVKGLFGGHSGMEIDKGRLNAHKILVEVLKDLKDKLDFRLISIVGGTKDNAIPRSSKANIAINEKDLQAFKSSLEEIKEDVVEKNKVKEENVDIEIEKKSAVASVLSQVSEGEILEILDRIPTGIYTKFKRDPSIVESSSNMAIVNIDRGKFIVQTSLRSSSSDLILKLEEEIIYIAQKYKADYHVSNEYPEWEFREKSQLRDTAIDVYREMTGKEIETSLIHAGLETGVFSKKYPDLDIISFGPNMKDIHTPEERLSISSTERTFEYLKNLLKALK